MSNDVRFERLLADVLADAAPARAPDALVPDILAAARRARRRPRWLALAMERPMRLDAQVVVGWPTRPMSRATFAAAALVVLLALSAALLVVGRGPSPTPSEEPSPSLPAIVAPSSTPSGPSAAPTASPVTDPAGVWIATGTMGTPRFDPAAVRLLDGRVLVVGGSGDESDPASAELYDPASGTWSPTGNMPKRQAGFPPTLLLDGRVLVGDVGEPDSATEDDEIAGAEVYDPASGTWSSAGQVCIGDTATLLRDGKVLVACQSGPQVYDPDSGTWSATGKMITPRHAHTATLLRDGKVLVAGGYDGGDAPVDAAELYDPDTGSWTSTANTSLDGRSCTGCPGGVGWATLLPDGTLLYIREGSVVPFAQIYDPATGAWTTTAEMARPDILLGEWSSPALLSDGRLLVAGLLSRRADSPPPCTAAVLFNPRTGSWTTASSMLRCGNSSSFTLLLDGTVLVAGGRDCNDDGLCVDTGSAELYVPAGVSPPPLPAFPSPPPPVIPSPTPEPTPFPPAAGPVPPNARVWKVTVDNESSEPVTLSVAAADGTGPLQLVGSASPNVVPAGATVKVTFFFPVNGGRADGWICVDLRPGDEAGLVEAADIGIPGKILITAEGQTGWLSP